MTERVRSLRAFLAEFVDEHAIAGGGDSDELLLDVTPEEAEDLGVFFVRGMCGWMHGLRRMRAEQSSAEVSGEAADETLEGISEVEAEFIQ